MTHWQFINRPWTPEEDSLLRSLIAERCTIRVLCSTLNRGKWAVVQRLKHLGLRKPSMAGGDLDDQLKAAYAAGKSVRQIARETGFAISAISERATALRLGLQGLPRHKRRPIIPRNTPAVWRFKHRGCFHERCVRVVTDEGEKITVAVPVQNGEHIVKVPRSQLTLTSVKDARLVKAEASPNPTEEAECR